jgi:ABC-type lipoprotein release transport system permease subunit
MTGTIGTRTASARFWARHELASRWRSLVVLGLLAGIAGGVATAAFAGAQRTETAYARYRVATASPTAVIFGTQAGDHNADYRAVQRLPEVIDSGKFNLAAIGIKSIPGSSSLAPSDSHLYRTLARPLVVDGRLPNPHRVDEILVNKVAAKQLHLKVGQPVTLVSSPNLNAFYGQAPMTGGPTVKAHIVGIGSGPMDLLFGPDDPGFIPSGAFLQRWGTPGIQAPKGRVAEAANLVVRLRPGTNLVKFHRDVANALHLTDGDGHPVAGKDVPIRDIAEDNKRVEHATDLERTGLLLFAAAVALAGLMLVGQAITRVVFAIGDSAPTLRAIGFVRRQLLAGMVLPMMVAAAIGAAVTVVVAIALSPRFPVGLAGQLDPDRGVHFAATAVLSGTLVVAVLTLVVAFIAALRSTSPRPATAHRQSSRIVAGVRAVAPPPISIGTGLALERGRGDRSLPVRLAIFGGIVAVVGVIGCLGLLHGINDALHQPTRSGQVWDATAFPETAKDLSKTVTVMRRDPAVNAIAVERRKTLNVGGTGLPLYALEPLRGHRTFTVLHGHAPSGTNEVLLGPSTSRALHRDIGSHITLASGNRPSVRMSVVGVGLLPQEAHSSFDQGAWVSPTGFARITGGSAAADFESGDVRVVATFRPSAKAAAVGERISNTAHVEVDPIVLPQDVLLLRNVRTLPKDLAIFLVLLGVAALGHALVTAVRRRRHDIAVLRTLGFTPRQAALCIAAQASTIGVISLVIGIPLGLVAGQLAWRWVADVTPLLYVAPVTVFAIVLLIPATVLGVNLLAAWPANRASRIRPADVLRTDSSA